MTPSNGKKIGKIRKGKACSSMLVYCSRRFAKKCLRKRDIEFFFKRDYSSARSVNTIDPEILEILIFTF